MQERRAHSPSPVSQAGPPAGSGTEAGRRGARAGPSGPARMALLLVIATGVVVLDQWSKSWALGALGEVARRHVIGPVYLSLTFNSGAAFSLGAGASPVIEAVAIALVVGVVVFSRRAAKGGTNLAVIVGLGLLLGGALSNLGDRLFRHNHGAVVDFIQLVSWWPTFNVADAAITVGAVTLVVALVFFTPVRRTTGPEPAVKRQPVPCSAPGQPADDRSADDRSTDDRSGRAAQLPGGESGQG
ncbi:MAG TPA: signal peptidase II [Acidimicrobiales bacterium]|nr:signal peptidase II [Acidimicrobiales bacterium]